MGQKVAITIVSATITTAASDPLPSCHQHWAAATLPQQRHHVAAALYAPAQAPVESTTLGSPSSASFVNAAFSLMYVHGVLTK